MSLLSFRYVQVLFVILLLGAMFSGQMVLIALLPLVLLLLTGFSRPAFLYFVLLATIPLSAEYQFNSSLGTDVPDEAIMWLLSPIVLFHIIRNGSFRLLSSPIILLIVLSFVWTCFTVLFSGVPLVSVKFVLAKAWYILPFVFGSMLFVRSESSQWIAAKAILLPMLFAAIVIMFRHAGSGFRFETVNDVTAPFFRNHVNYGALLVCVVPVAFAAYRLKRGFWIAVPLILLVALVFSYSRGAWLALAAAIVTIMVMRKGWMKWLIGLTAVLVLAASVWLLNGNRYLRYRPLYERTIYHASFDEHMQATYNLQDLSTMERFYRWIAAVNMAKQNWITGHGPNSFYPIYKSYTVNEFRTYVSANPEKSTVHNYFLLLLTEQGIPGVLFFAVLLVVMIMKAQHVYLHSSLPHLRSVALVIGAVLAMIFVLINLSDLIETDKIGPVFYICAGLLAGMDLRERGAIAGHQAHPEARSPVG